MKLTKETEEKIQHLQLLEQNLQAFLVQKQTLQTQLVELESAMEELKETKEAYKIIGNIMVNMKKEALQEDIKERKERTELRLKTIEKQENKIKEKAQELQKEVLGDIKE